jgi:hypothetical protein
MDELIHALVGDFFRLLDYPGKGLASEQSFPPEVMEAYHLLRHAGCTRQLPQTAQ